jgi:hypothetical protein
MSSTDTHDTTPSKSITKLHVPLTVVVTVLVFMAGGVASVSLVWWKTIAHAHEATVHVDPTETVRGGGVAFKADVVGVQGSVRDLKGEFERRLSDYGHRTREALRSMTIKCRRSGDGLVCNTDVPREAPP